MKKTPIIFAAIVFLAAAGNRTARAGSAGVDLELNAAARTFDGNGLKKNSAPVLPLAALRASEPGAVPGKNEGELSGIKTEAGKPSFHVKSFKPRASHSEERNLWDRFKLIFLGAFAVLGVVGVGIGLAQVANTSKPWDRTDRCYSDKNVLEYHGWYDYWGHYLETSREYIEPGDPCYFNNP